MLKILTIIISFRFVNVLTAEIPHYLDFKYILNQSDAGKKLKIILKSTLDNGLKNISIEKKNFGRRRKNYSTKKVISSRRI